MKKLILLSIIIAGVLLGISCNRQTAQPAATNTATASNVPSNDSGEDLQRRIKLAELSEPQAQELVTTLLMDCDANDPRNNYIPVFAKNKLNELALKSNTGQIVLEAVATINEQTTRDLMMATYMEGRPSIFIFVPKINILLVRDFNINYKVEKRYPQELKNTFLIGIVHEMVHLENPSFDSMNAWTEEENLAEEARTWLKTNRELVRPLRASGQPLKIDMVEFDDVATRCKDNINCKELKDLLKSKVAVKDKQIKV